MDAFGTRNDWTTWSGQEIGQRVHSYLDSKISSDHCNGHDKSTGADASGPSVCETSEMKDFYNFVDPPITLEAYIQRIVQYTRVSISPVNLAVALLYIERLEMRGKIEVCKYTVFRLFCTAYLIAFKRMEDPPVMKNAAYCKIAGIPLYELNRLEMQFLLAIDFELGVLGEEDICQKITKILLPPKAVPGIIIAQKNECSEFEVARWTPDSVVDLEDALQYDGEDEEDGGDCGKDHRSYHHDGEDEGEEEYEFEDEGDFYNGAYGGAIDDIIRSNSAALRDRDIEFDRDRSRGHGVSDRSSSFGSFGGSSMEGDGDVFDRGSIKDFYADIVYHRPVENTFERNFNAQGDRVDTPSDPVSGYKLPYDLSAYERSDPTYKSKQSYWGYEI